MEYESYDIKFNQGTSKVHRFYTKKGGSPIFLIHGYFEDGRIFFTKKGKGFAPFLQKMGLMFLFVTYWVKVKVFQK